MTIKELVGALQQFKDQDRPILVKSARDDPFAYKERFAEPEIFLRDDGVVLILPKKHTKKHM